MASTFNARDASVYELSMGRWSRRMAPGLIGFAGIGPAQRVLDVGCGTGSLLFHLAHDPALSRITGIDASPIYTQAARARTVDPRIEIVDGDACAMPFGDGAFDAALSQLVLQFVPDPMAAVQEMRRVVSPGGVVVAAVWNSGGGMPHQRMFWDTAAMLDPEAVVQRGRAFARPMTRKDDLPRLFSAAGLRDVSDSFLTVAMDFADFEDMWRPIAQGEGTLGKYVLGMEAGLRNRFETALRAAYEGGEPDGARRFHCSAYVARGIVS